MKSSYAVYQSLLEARQKQQEAAAAVPPSEANAEQPPPAEPPTEAAPPEEPQPPQTPPEAIVPSLEPVEAAHQLRSTPTQVSPQDIPPMIQARGFHHPNDMSHVGLTGTIQGDFTNAYEEQTIEGDPVIVDRATGLIWQPSGSPDPLSWDQAQEYVAQLNQRQYAAYTDWRLPTVEELASLLEFEQQNGTYYLDPRFDATQSHCWTSDPVATSSTNAVWVVAFHSGHIFYDPVDRTNYVRAVR
ncbi:DUF1566 domain-containing protein [candidate division KSB3 bacterium]|uniref:DUF1566 domain-containing protein n=1 Tax=candidate division KSB3 bacterium TaxID=2044937 RepID=A0A9D5JS48_9BACT|nr:DUF1566 domain-containing protein [candidate division KSB3 bacterium]MBD3323183.1 DUF1566 domain-containing protein [candidate division KSB3 bacterium]